MRWSKGRHSSEGGERQELKSERERDINSGTFLSVPAIFGVHVPCAVAGAGAASVAAAAAIYLL